MSEITIMNMDCTHEDGVCNCDISDMHMSCYRNRTEVYAALPESGKTGTTYYIGTNAGGYTEYVWNGTAFVELGTASGSFYNRATVDALGLVKLSTASVVSGGSVIGMNSDGQLRVPVATLTAYGAVKLGSQYHPTNEIPYVVGIGCSASATTYGQLCFNLSPTQSDGSPGCLVYEQISDSPIEYTMKVKEGSASQMGIVKLLSSLTGYTDEEITAMRDTHAASVGLVVDGLDTFCEGFFTEYRMQGYFDEWASGKSLSQEIWDDEAKRGVLVADMTANVLGSDEVFSVITERVSEVSLGWLNGNITADYIDGLFGERVLAKTAELVDAHWTNRLDATIEANTAREVGVQLEGAIASWFSVKENVRAVSDIVVSTVSGSVVAEAEGAAVDYMKSVVNGGEKMTVDGSTVKFDEWVSSKIEELVYSRTASFDDRISTIISRLNWTEDRAVVLGYDGSNYVFSSYNPAVKSDTFSKGIPLGRYTHTVSLPAGKYRVRLTNSPIAPDHRDRNQVLKAVMTDSSGEEITRTYYRWYGDTGKSNDECTAGYFAGVGTIEVPASGTFTFTIETLRPSGGAMFAYVMVEFL